MTLTPPFAIGQTLWTARTSPQQATIACPVCFGKRVIRVELGNGELVPINCDGCGLGYEGPRGIITEYDHSPAADPFTIAEVVAFQNNEWTFKSDDGKTAYNTGLYLTKSEALAESQKRCDEFHERNIMTRGGKRAGVKKAGWTVRYHRREIANLERDLAWHRAKVNAVSELPIT